MGFETLPHEFDSSRTCDYCGIASELAVQGEECSTRRSLHDVFTAHFKKTAAEVATWPRWKQLALGEFPKKTTDIVEPAVVVGVQTLVTKCEALEHLCGDILACLELNKEHFFRDDEPARKVFDEVSAKWRKEYGRLTS